MVVVGFVLVELQNVWLCIDLEQSDLGHSIFQHHLDVLVLSIGFDGMDYGGNEGAATHELFDMLFSFLWNTNHGASEVDAYATVVFIILFMFLMCVFNDDHVLL